MTTLIFSENFESSAIGIIPSTGTSWRQHVDVSGRNRWIIGDASGVLNGTKSTYISDTSGATLGLYTYLASSASTSRLVSPSINTVGAYDNLNLFFNYKCNGEVATTLLDYGTLEYSLDGSGFTVIGPAYQGVSTTTMVSVNLPAACLNKSSLYLGWRWSNDNATLSNPPFGIDNILLYGFKNSCFNVLFNENFESFPIKVVDTSGTSWRQRIDASGTNRWVFGDSSSNSTRSAYISNTVGSTGPFANTYTNSFTTNTKLISPPINTSGSIGLLLLSFNYLSNGADNAFGSGYTTATMPRDYGIIEYSTDGSGFNEFSNRLYNVTSTTNIRLLLPDACLNQSQLYLGWKWINNSNSTGTSPPFNIDDIVLYSTTVITITPLNSLSLETDEPANIYYSITNATTVTVTGLPVSLSYTFSKNILRIYGTPDVASSSLITISASNPSLSSIIITKTDTITVTVPTITAGLPCITANSILQGRTVSTLNINNTITVESGTGGTTIASISRLKRYDVSGLLVYNINNDTSNNCNITGKTLIKRTNQSTSETVEVNNLSQGFLPDVVSSTSNYNGLVYRIELDTSGIRFAPISSNGSTPISLEMPCKKDETNIPLGTLF